MKYKNDQISSCPCLRGLLWLAGSCIFACASLFIALNYDNNARWIEWIQLFVSSAGAIAIPIAIWWLSSYRSEKLKEKKLQIETLNCIYGDLFGISNLIVDLAEFITSNIRIASNALIYIKISKDKFKFNFNIYNQLYSYNLGKFPVAEFSLKYSELNINFISRNSPDLYSYLFQLDKCMKHMQKSIEVFRQNLVNNSIQKENLSNSIQLTEEEKRAIKVPYNLDILLERKKLSIEQNFLVGYIESMKDSLNTINGIIKNIKKTIYALDRFCDEKYPNQISLHSEKEKRYFGKILNYKNESELIIEAIENLYPNSRNTDKTKKITKILCKNFIHNPLFDIIYSMAEILDENLTESREILLKHAGKKYSVVITPETIQMLEKVMPDIENKIDGIRPEQEKDEFRTIFRAAINSIR
ncbi:MAG: hypothetical protein DBX55_09795 [Verrucomicrobia bacterium]|nr:MAG: hypothetical protein DBX55_09795 [Verrucomicrobiota bacterium]